MPPWPGTVVLKGTRAQLELLSQAHCDALTAAVKDGELWRLWYTSVPPPEKMKEEIERRLKLREQGTMLPFAVIDLATGQPVGMTTYMNIDADVRRVEIGSTWYRQAVQRSPLNTECKLLLLRHAFEKLDCVAVEFRTHLFNHQSRRAIERLGAKFDGVLRSQMRMRDGTLRDTCVYSIIASEWPTVRSHLTWQLERPREHTITTTG
jgi:RimJ/RimL family protein N-acetyltransferase